MADTPKNLLSALDMMTREEAPRPEVLGVVHATQFRRARTVFEDPNIIGIGISEKVTDKAPTGQLSLCFYVEKKLAKQKVDSRKFIPPVIATPDGSAVFTDVKQTGRIVPQANIRKSPLQSGYSVGHIKVTAGTLGAIVKRGKKYFILSNSHVLALSGKSKIGDRILYPGKLDGGKAPKDLVGTLSNFIPFEVGDKFVNRVDAAIAEIAEERVDDIDFDILGLKSIGVIDPVRGMKVVKRGRTTGNTESTVQDVNFRVVLEYDGIGKVGFLDQVLCDRYTGPGDSGSIVVEKKSGKIVGLHFAGASGGSVFNPIAAVIKTLNFQFASA